MIVNYTQNVKDLTIHFSACSDRERKVTTTVNCEVFMMARDPRKPLLEIVRQFALHLDCPDDEEILFVGEFVRGLDPVRKSNRKVLYGMPARNEVPFPREVEEAVWHLINDGEDDIIGDWMAWLNGQGE